MGISNLNLTKISTAITSVISILEVGGKIIDLSKNIATGVINYYTAFIENNNLSGASKKQIVFDLVRDTWDEIVGGNGIALFTEWVNKISIFIDAFHSSFTSLKTDFSALKETLFGTQDATQAATPATATPLA